MKIITIKYEKVFPIAAYQNEKIGVEVSVGEDENEMFLFGQVKQIVESMHQKSVMVDEMVANKPPINTPPIDNPHADETPIINLSDRDRFLDAIIDAKSIGDLASIKPNLPKELLPDYMKKMKQLTPKTVY